jgi:biopolymer transport protein ExbD
LPEVPVDLPGTPNATVVVAIDQHGQIYYDGQAAIDLADLRARLRAVVERSEEPVTLEVQADKAATLETTAPVLSLAHDVGMSGALLVTRPRPGPVFTGPRP